MHTNTTFLGLMFVLAAVAVTWVIFAKAVVTRAMAIAMMTTAVWGLFKAEAPWIDAIVQRGQPLGRFTHTLGSLPWGLCALATWAVVAFMLAAMYFFGLDENLCGSAADDDEQEDEATA